MSFMALKAIHLLCAACSFTLFFLRGLWHLQDSALLRQRWLKVTPHVVDTLLLASALAMAVTLGQYPLVDGWLSAKFFALLLYIALGSLALRPGLRKRIRLMAWLAAQSVFIYIVLVAIKHNPLPFNP